MPDVAIANLHITFDESTVQIDCDLAGSYYDLSLLVNNPLNLRDWVERIEAVIKMFAPTATIVSSPQIEVVGSIPTNRPILHLHLSGNLSAIDPNNP